MAGYSGCIIKESLKDLSILDEFDIVDEDICTVKIDKSKIENILPRLQAAMVDDKVWYCDLKCNDYHYIIFNDKIFKIDRNYGEQYEEAKKYGLNRGIPEEQLPNSSWAKQV